ncbi:GNAT family N-acetyltransferase [Streptomyces sp. SID13666]|uniref:GNAT family N-acetyltransferase n=1 Tax=unclassified Streptomyces TaxID=2593676 RepID=UPI0013C117CC|nr:MULTISPECIES: GNAT family N-acetyltransferase [unclassified Streptomyces]NEA53322.1 GNAT family N-acetyltransferase [Streptomyces sp. SID13666]NEA69351.1 GNAT family N-acetyltransferase [Streptomyces sp. SID13588]
MKIEQVPWADPDATSLRVRQRAEIAVRYGTPDSEPGTAPSEADIATFFMAREDDGTAVGCGGLRHLGDGVGEVKRMYVAPAWRGSGIALRILRALEDWARERGWTSLRLETGDAQPDAVRFYTRAGYERIPNFGAYAGTESSLCFERLLERDDHA